MLTKRVNIFTYGEDYEAKKIKRIIGQDNYDGVWCRYHERICGPQHQRYWIDEEKRWMNSWEEYKYTDSKDYYLDKPVSYCGSFDGTRPCVMCNEPAFNHEAMKCRGKVLRIFYNKYTHYIAGIPCIYDAFDLYEGRWTQ